MTKRWFITGTDTEAGKTFASCLLLRAAQAHGWRSVGYKPVAAGCEVTAAGLRNADALALQANSSVAVTYSQVNPIALQAATSPHIASLRQGESIQLDRITAGLKALEQYGNWILIEGAGGWYTPLNHRHTFADWVSEQRLPVILVVAMKLGCINHALLTAQAITSAGLTLAGWLANQIQPASDDYPQYLDSLIQRLNAPLLGEIPYSPQGLPSINCLSLAALA